MKALYLLILCMVFGYGCQNKTTPALAPVSYTVPDSAAIKKAVDDAYAAISFKKGEQPRTDQIANFFTPQAQLINYRTDSAATLGITQFVDAYKQFIIKSKITYFQEDELFGRTEQFGRIAHRISTYRTFLNNPDTAAERGVNSFQLIKTNTGWKVSSIIWDVEKPSLKIPDYYLKK